MITLISESLKELFSRRLRPFGRFMRILSKEFEITMSDFRMSFLNNDERNNEIILNNTKFELSLLITPIDAFDVVDGADHQVALQFRIDLLNAFDGNGATHQ